MLASENQEIRARAVAKIISIRESLPEVKGKGKRGKNTRGKGESSRDEDDNHDDEIRIFQAPKPVYTAESFESMIDWDKEQICPPPYLQFHTNEEIRQFESMPLRIDVPSNTQHVERFIQINAKVGTKAASIKARNGLVLARQEYLEKNPSRGKKADTFKK